MDEPISLGSRTPMIRFVLVFGLLCLAGFIFLVYDGTGQDDRDKPC